MTLTEYLQLFDWTGRRLKPGKRGAIPNNTLPILDSLNLLPRRGFEDLASPRIRTIGALTLSKSSQGNALGVGNADFITRALRNDIDEYKTLVNTLHLDRLFVSEDFVHELSQHPACCVSPLPLELAFVNGRQQLIVQ